jgi:succinate dehydrogenase/fumarate reductase flavoprotein subunit
VWARNRTRWHLDADVVVLGYGGAGAVAAITAHDAGAAVTVVEKQSRSQRFPNTFMSGGSLVCPSDPEQAIEHMKALYRSADGGYETGPEVLAAWAHWSADNVAWIERNGGSAHLFSRVGEHHTVPGYEAIQSYRFGPAAASAPATATRGYGLFRWLQQLVEERQIDVEYDTAARWLLTDAAGAVLGVQAVRGGRVVNIRAHRAVILTTGGFEFNQRLKLDHLRVSPTYFYASPDSTGDGVLMAQEVGAALWHMSACSAKAIAKFPDFPTGFPVNFWGYGDGMTQEELLYRNRGAGPGQGGSSRQGASPGQAAGSGQGAEPPAATAPAACGVMQVDRAGRRFTNEVWQNHTHYYELTGFDSQRGQYPRIPCYWIFDSARLNRGQLALRETGAAGPLRLYPWSQDNQRELDQGWIIRGETIEDLARTLAMDPAVLRDTLRAYNDGCAAAADPLGPPPHGRPPGTLVPLEPPFYAVRLWPGGPNTQGGPERNARAQVMRVTGEPVPRLYAAGELGSIYGMLYPVGGANIGECIAFGRIAGENASAEPSR